MYKLFLFFCLFGGLSFSLSAQEAPKLHLVQKPISYTAERIELSKAYLKERHGIIQNDVKITPKIIVLHYTAGGTLESNFNYFNNTRIENARSLNKNQSPLNVSSQFLVDRDGTVYQLMPADRFARHIIGLNYCAIGVENIAKNEKDLTPQQVLANIALVRYLKKHYPIEYLIGHNEYGKFRNSTLWKEKNPKYFTQKPDPGAGFMRKVRAGLSDLNLKSEP